MPIFDRVGRVHCWKSSPIVVCTLDFGAVGGIPWFDLCLGSRLTWPYGPATLLVCTIMLVGILGIFAGPLVPVLQSGLASFAIVCPWQLAGIVFVLAIGCVGLPVLGVAPSWGPPLELAPKPELGCVL